MQHEAIARMFSNPPTPPIGFTVNVRRPARFARDWFPKIDRDEGICAGEEILTLVGRLADWDWDLTLALVSFSHDPVGRRDYWHQDIWSTDGPLTVASCEISSGPGETSRAAEFFVGSVAHRLRKGETLLACLPPSVAHNAEVVISGQFCLVVEPCDVGLKVTFCYRARKPKVWDIDRWNVASDTMTRELVQRRAPGL